MQYVKSALVLEAMLASQLYIVIEQYSYDAKYSASNLINAKIVQFWEQFAPGFQIHPPIDIYSVTIFEQDEIIRAFVEWTLTNYPEENETVQKNIVLCFLYKYIDVVVQNYNSKTGKKLDSKFHQEDYEITNAFPSKVYEIIYQIRRNEWSITTGGKRNKRTKKRRKNRRTKRRNPYLV
jgi:hypothetical protein